MMGDTGIAPRQGFVRRLTATLTRGGGWNAEDPHEVHGLGMRVYGVSRYVARYPQVTGDYFSPGFEFQPGMTVLDIGANVGLFTLQVLRRCMGNARVLAFEPAPQNFAHLERNLAELWPEANVQTFRCAVSAVPGEATFYYRPRVPMMSSLSSETPKHDPDAMIEAALRSPPAQFGTTFLQRMPRPVRRAVLRSLARWTAAPEPVEVPCPVATVSGILQENRIDQVDYLKIDVEGAELDVLVGVEAQDWPKIRQVSVETHDIDGRLDQVCSMLNQAGLAAAPEQHWPFEGTDIHMVHGIRATHPASSETVSR
jgi:FkbM family methyltransferase